MENHKQPASPFENFDFSELNSPEFKEDSVREEIISPLLNALGYSMSGKYRIVRSKKLKHPFVKVGAGDRRINNFPDYLLLVEGTPGWVLDAKDPDEEITDGEHREQAYFYAIHPDIRVRYYALCNGKEFALFAINAADPVLYFHVSEINKHWNQLEYLLSPEVFAPEPQSKPLVPPSELNYAAAKIPGPMATRKQTAKRHYGVHGYFTRQPYDLVQAHIKTFTQPGDVILDPYGGYGVTALEALVLDRKAIHIDLNPWSVFILKSLAAPVDLQKLQNAFDRIMATFEKFAPRTDAEVKKALAIFPYPKDVELPKSADVRKIQELFSPLQLAQLAYLKSLIVKVRDENVRNSLLLCFSSALNKFNLTFHYTKSIGGGDSGMFRYYRYRMAPKPGQNALESIFSTKYEKLLAAKKEMAPLINEARFRQAKIYKGNAADLSDIPDESVDYIYTDPPYGAKIAYLDLSVMWNAWLDLPVSEGDYEVEAIEGGMHKRTKEDYARLISESIEQMYRVLKFDRWMSFVFQHKDPSYWHLIVEAATKAGFEHIDTVTQKVGQATFKKRQNPFTVLHGQLVIHFRKVRNPRAALKVQLGGEMSDLVMQTIEALIAKNQGATLEEIYNELIMHSMVLGFLDELSKEQQNIPALLREHFEFNQTRQVYELKKNTKFKTRIRPEVRIKYYLYSYMHKMQRQNIFPRFEDIVLNIMPLLKNGITPKHQTILNVLEQAAEQTADGRWKLVEGRQMELQWSGKSMAVDMPEPPGPQPVPDRRRVWAKKKPS